MHIPYDPDRYKAVTESKPCTVCGGDLKKCNGACNGSASYTLVERDPQDYARVRAERIKREEDEILLRAAEIRARRGG